MANIHDARCKVNTCNINPKEVPIKVLLGADKEAFYVHESVIRKPKTYFDAALSKEWKEGQERVVELEEDNAVAFELYVQWLYTGSLFCKADNEERDFESNARMYVLGEKLLDQRFQDDVMDAMIATTHDLKSVDAAEWPGQRVIQMSRQLASSTKALLSALQCVS